MNKLMWTLAVGFLAVVAVTGAVLVTRPASPPSAASGGGQAAGHAASPSPSPSPSASPPATPTPTPSRTAASPSPSPARHRTGPWDVVNAYYSDVRSHRYRAAWGLISAGTVTGQTYQQFVAGYSCTGTVHITELGEAGDEVTFTLVASDHCTGHSQRYTGTDTVHGGKIVAADVRQSG